MTNATFGTMPAVNQPSKGVLWTGRVLSALPVLMLVFSAVMKFAKPPAVVQEFTRLGYAEHLAIALGILELACAIIYAIPATSVLGAILLTGYLGGATPRTCASVINSFSQLFSGSSSGSACSCASHACDHSSRFGVN
jgi:hypothetical protein